MDDKKNGIEEFFNSSLEKFDQIPDDKVWAGISGQLDLDDVGKTTLWSKNVDERTVAQEGGLSSLNKSKDKTPATIQSIVTPVTTERELITATKSSASINQREIQSNTQNNVSDKEKGILTKLKEKSQPAKIIKSINSTSNNKAKPNAIVEGLTREPSLLNPNPPATKENVKPSSIDNLNSNNQQATKEIDTPNRNQIKSTGLELEEKIKTLNPLNLLNSSNQTLFSHSKIVIPDSRLTYLKSQLNQKQSKYRIGLSTRLFNTFVSQSNSFSGSNSMGLVQDYKIRENLAMNLGIYFNEQDYEIKKSKSSNSLDDVVVMQYTSRSFQENSVTGIEADMHYIDVPLGLTWYFKPLKRGKSLFLNSSIVWQIYFPQSFGFKTIDEKVIIRKSDAIVASLGSGNLELGIEKRLSSKFDLQLSIWGEASFIPLGIQQEKFKMLGLKAAVLFGN